MNYIHFFNLEYWFCIIGSLFGAKCTTVEQLAAPSVSVPNVTGSVPQAAASAPGFWQWLFGSLFGSGASGSGSSIFTSGPLGAALGIIGLIFSAFWSAVNVVAFMLSFLLLACILVSVVGIFFIRLAEHERYGNLAPVAARAHPLRARWQALLEDAMSADPKRWRSAIFSADEMLGDLFARLGYAGRTTAERITAVPEGAFANLPAAWEAHRIKNFIGAPTSRFVLTQREAFRVMKLYEQVFREFDFI